MKLPKFRKREVRIGTAIMLCVMTAVTSVNISYILFQRVLEEKLPGYQANNEVYGKLGQIRSLFEELYVGTYDEQTAIDTAAAGYVAGVGDRWSGYYSAEEYEAYVESFGGESSGIGAYVSYTPENGIRIIEVYEGSDCERVGLTHGDRILSADDATLAEDGYNAVMNAIAGEEGTSVKVGIERAATGEREVVELTRKTVEQKMVTGKMLEDHVGFIRIYNFHQGSEKQFEKLMEELLDAGAEAFVFDVRNDPGGAVDSVNEMLDYLLPEGDLMGLSTKAGKEQQYTSDKKCVDLPMAVLVDAESISAAEFFAACLQEYEWATVVGEQTIGKGYSQRMYSLVDGSAVRISDKMYYLPSGRSLIGTGVLPDVEVGLPDEKEPDFYFLSPAEDDQLSAALAALP
ncbi:MAG: PDZ domain-containing protein [Butyricicoccus sp.]|nr:PDZ domain-containing protein [Butyricicoccus sp.]